MYALNITDFQTFWPVEKIVGYNYVSMKSGFLKFLRLGLFIL